MSTALVAASSTTTSPLSPPTTAATESEPRAVTLGTASDQDMGTDGCNKGTRQGRLEFQQSGGLGNENVSEDPSRERRPASATGATQNSAVHEELERILTSVARTGHCPWLPWSEPDGTIARSHCDREPQNPKKAELPASEPGQAPLELRGRSDNGAGNDRQSIAREVSCQREAFRLALQMVLDSFYSKTGYKINAAEKQLHAQMRARLQPRTSESTSLTDENQRPSHSGLGTLRETTVSNTSRSDFESATKHIFLQRRKRLLQILDGTVATETHAPFTLQRVAEVILSPERYYSQTHKLCNCLEKLLLITASEHDLGVGCGAKPIKKETKLEPMEKQEIQALEKGRHRLKRRLQPYSEDMTRDRFVFYGDSQPLGSHSTEPLERMNGDVDRHDSLSAGSHLGIKRARQSPETLRSQRSDQHRKHEEARATNSSPPPPTDYACSGPAVGLTLSTQVPVPTQRKETDLTASPDKRYALTLQNQSDASAAPLASINSNATLQLLQLHHAAALAGVSPLDLMNFNADSQMGNAASLHLHGAGGRDADVESRSSCSSDIDLDSESDVSFDDSASDRSDGSDGGHTETTSAVRSTTLNRVQYHQRLQSRLLSSFHPNIGIAQHENNQPELEESSRDTRVDRSEQAEVSMARRSSSEMSD